MIASQRLRYLLLQIRNHSDAMRKQEIDCFSLALGCHPERIETHDILATFPTRLRLDQFDMVLIGGSGDYSAAKEGVWLDRILDGLRMLADKAKPTFASCWGFQAFARALEGECIHDPANAELGTIEFTLTEAGRNDPVFGTLPSTFLAQAGHEDRVSRLPACAALLASSDRVSQQAMRIIDKPIYATQFHPELNRQALIERIENYPRYVEQIAELPLDTFVSQCQETPEANGLLRRFVATYFE